MIWLWIYNVWSMRIRSTQESQSTMNDFPPTSIPPSYQNPSHDGVFYALVVWFITQEGVSSETSWWQSWCHCTVIYRQWSRSLSVTLDPLFMRGSSWSSGSLWCMWIAWCGQWPNGLSDRKQCIVPHKGAELREWLCHASWGIYANNNAYSRSWWCSFSWVLP